MPNFAKAQALHVACDKYQADINEQLPTPKILIFTGLATFISSGLFVGAKQMRNEPYELGSAGILLGFITGNIYGAAQTCAYGTASKANDVGPDEINPYDTLEYRKSKRNTTLIYVTLNSLANFGMANSIPNSEVKAVSTFGGILPWVLLGYYWNDFMKKAEPPAVTTFIAPMQDNLVVGLRVGF